MIKEYLCEVNLGIVHVKVNSANPELVKELAVDKVWEQHGVSVEEDDVTEVELLDKEEAL